MGKLRKKGSTELRAAGAANFLVEEGDDKKHTQFENWRMVTFFQVYNAVFFILGSTLAGMGIKLSSDASSSGSSGIFETAYVMVISAGIGMVLHSMLGLVSVYLKSVRWVESQELRARARARAEREREIPNPTSQETKTHLHSRSQTTSVVGSLVRLHDCGYYVQHDEDLLCHPLCALDFHDRHSGLRRHHARAG